MAKSEKHLSLPDEVKDTMFACALRFDGWRWLERSRFDDLGICPEAFRPIIDPICDTLTFHEDEMANFAAFFILQRYLYKEGIHTPFWRREHTAFRFLFLHLYPHPTPREFQLHEEAWREVSIARRRRHAAIVRETLLSSNLRRDGSLEK